MARRQSANKVTPPSLLAVVDKVYFCGGLKLLKFEHFGADVQLKGESYKEEFEILDIERPWITDHLGIMAEFDVVD